MTDHQRELSNEEVKKAENEGIYSLFSDWEKMGYGVYGARIVEVDGKHILRYSMGSSCD